MDNRREKRYISYAKIRLIGKNNLGYLRDLNSLGCQIDFIDPPPIQVEDTIEVQIIPNEELDIQDFELFLTVKWIRQDSVYFSIGGSVSRIPEVHADVYEKLIAYFKG